MSGTIDRSRDTGALQLLRELLLLDPARREAALQSRCGHDPALLQRVRALLGHVDEDELHAADDAATAPDVSGLRFGAYRVIKRIGSGGMGEVFRARRDDGSFEREVAIKRIWGGFGLLAARFIRERDVLARLQHPHIAQLLDGGVTEQGHPWFAMELVRGESITHWCDARKLDLPSRVQLFEQVCDAVEFAHRNLIVHRDLKPGNVLVDEVGNVKLLDFGIAKLLDDVDPEQTQTLAMTPAWAAPEQRRGEAITTATDVWQLGMLLRTLLSGQHADAERLSNAYAALQKRDGDAAASIATRRGTTPDALQRQLRGDLEHIVALATADHPPARYSSAQSLAADMRRWRAGQPVHARRDERGYRARRMAKRYWPALAAGVAAIAFAGYHLHAQQRALNDTRIALQRAVNAERLAVEQTARANLQRDRTRNLAEYFDRLFESATPADIEKGNVTAQQLLERSIASLQKYEHMPVTTRAQLMIAAGSALGKLNRLDESLQVTTQAVELLESMPQQDDDAKAAGYAALAISQNMSGQYPQAGQTVQKGLALYTQNAASDAAARVQLEQVRGMLAQRTGDQSQAREAYDKVVQFTGDDPVDIGMIRSRASGLINLAQMDDDPLKAEARLKQALSLIERKDPDNLELRFPVQMHLARALSRQEKNEEASALIDRTLAAAESYYASGEPWLGAIMATAGKLDRKLGRLPRAEARLRRARDILQTAYGLANPVALNAQQGLVFAQLMAGRHDAARRELQAWQTSAPRGNDAEDAPARRIAQAVLACHDAPTPEALAQLEQTLASMPANPKASESGKLRDWTGDCRQRVEARSGTRDP